VLAAFKRADSSQVFSRVWHRVDVGDGLDLVLTLGSSRKWNFLSDGTFFPVIERFGIFLQERKDPGRVFQITVAPRFPCDSATLARATPTDTLIWCVAEKSAILPAQKFVYDIRAKALVARFEFKAFTNFSVRRRDEWQMSLIGHSADRQVALSLTPPTEFAVTNVTRRAIEGLPPRVESTLDGRRFGPGRSFRLVETASDTDECSREIVVSSAGRRYRVPNKAFGSIGPNQEVGDRLWFGRAFYHGEGCGGTGDFGYFDATSHRFQMFRSPKVAPWSATAIHIAGESVWLALADHGEYGSTTGGVLMFPSPEGEPRHFNIGHCVGREFATLKEHLYLLTDCGVVHITPDGISGHIVDVTTDGRVRVVPGLP